MIMYAIAVSPDEVTMQAWNIRISPTDNFIALIWIILGYIYSFVSIQSHMRMNYNTVYLELYCCLSRGQ